MARSPLFDHKLRLRGTAVQSAGDFVPWTAMPGDKPPALANAKDDEFDATSFDTAKWTWVNQGSATIAQSGSGVSVLTVPSSATANSHILVQSAPTLPATVSLRVASAHRRQNFAGSGLCLRESSTGRLLHYNIGYVSGSGLALDRWTNPTTFSATARRVGGTAQGVSEIDFTQAYLRAELGTTSADFFWSSDGVAWIFFVNEPYASFLTPNQIGFSGISNNSIPAYNSYFYWFRVDWTAV